MVEDIKKKTEDLIQNSIGDPISPELKYVKDSIVSKAKIDEVKYDLSVKDFISNSISEDFNAKEGNFTPTNDLYIKLNDNTLYPKFNSYTYGIDNNEKFAQEQTTLDKWQNGLTKLALKTGSAVVGGTVGILNSLRYIPEAIDKGSLDPMFNTNFDKWLDDWNTKWDYSLPNYYTKAERDMNFWQSMGTANFWANDVTGGLSFTLGMIGSEAIWAGLTGGASLSTTGARIASKYGRVARAMKDVGLGLFKTEKIAQSALKEVKYASLLGEKLNAARFLYTSNAYEAGVEARTFMKESKDNFIQQYRETYGKDPDYYELQKFEEDNANVANTVFASNMAILAVGNTALYGKLFGVKTDLFKGVGKSLDKKLFGIGTKEIIDDVGKVTRQALKPTKIQKALSLSYRVGEPMFMEGLWEEGLQGTASTAGQKWLESKYDKNQGHKQLGVIDAFYEGLSHTYGSKEGFKEVGIGMLIGVLGGGLGGHYSKHSQARATEEWKAKIYNTYGKETLKTRFQANLQMLRAEENYNKAKEKNDITGMEMANKELLFSAVNADYLLDELDTSYEKFEAMIDKSNAEEFERFTGISAKDVDAQNKFKDELKKQYKEIIEDYKNYREYAEAIVGDGKIRGIKLEDSGGEVSDINETLKQAITYNLVMGKNSDVHAEKMLNELKKIVVGVKGNETAVEVNDLLLKTSKETRNKYKKVSERIDKAKKELEELDKKRREQASINSKKAENQKTTKTLNDLTNEIIEKEKEYESLISERVALIRTMETENPFRESTINESDLEKVDEDLAYIEKMLGDTKERNPQRYNEYQKALEEYHKAIGVFKGFNSVIKNIHSGKMNLGQSNDWISSAILKKSANEFTSKFFTELGNEYLGNQQEILQKTVNETEQEVVDDILSQINKKSGTIEEEIDRILSKNKFTADRYSKSKKDLKNLKSLKEEYKKLKKKINRAKNIKDKNQPLRVKNNYYKKKGIKTKVTEQDIARFKELSERLADIKLLEGTLNEEEISIKDLLDYQVQLEESKEVETQKTEFTKDETLDIGIQAEKSFTDKQSNKSLPQTYETVKVAVRKRKDKYYYQFSHLNIETFIKGLKDVEGVEVLDKNGKPTTIEKAKKQVGATFIIKTKNGEVTARIANKEMNIEVETEQFDNNVKWKIIDAGLHNQSYFDVYIDENGKFVPLKSDFAIKDIKGVEVQSIDEVYNIKPGEKVDFIVSLEDKYNVELEEKYRAKKITEDELRNQLTIYVVKNGKVVGVLKSSGESKPNTQSEVVHQAIRDIAVERYLKAIDTPVKQIDLGIKAPVKKVYKGTPNLVLKEENGKLVPQQKEFTKKTIKIVKAVGFIENGKTDLQADDYAYVKKISRKIKGKIPIIVFEYKGSKIAYPINLKNEVKDISVRIKNALNKGTDAQRIVKVNQILADYGLSVKDYGLNPLKSLDEQQEQINKLVKMSKEVVITPKIEDLTVEDLIDKATISIDLENKPFISPKILMDLENVKVKDKTGNIFPDGATEEEFCKK